MENPLKNTEIYIFIDMYLSDDKFDLCLLHSIRRKINAVSITTVARLPLLYFYVPISQSIIILKIRNNFQI